MHRWNVKQWVVPCAIGAATLVKFSVGLGSYSGQGTPPMFGDYEAQRHWMELTVHLPTSQWYNYDLQYWGLDYPPLTAYVSWLCGIVAYYINPAWVALDTSRGIETPESKVFMRTSVVVLDALVYVPALVMFTRVWQGSRSMRTQELALLTLLLQPALLLIDFGHFQYNSVMLGFTLLAMNFFATEHDLIGAFFFVLSLGFKQMALYYAPAIGSYLLAKCLYMGPSKGYVARLFLRLAVVTIATFVLLFLPFLSPTLIMDPVTRIFPFARGLFEDKVANFWCASNVLLKWKSWASRSFLVKLSAGLTLMGFIPSVVVLLNLGWRMGAARRANKSDTGKKNEKEHTPFLPLLPYALLSSSMSFFLFSFQVHEKTILLPLMPVTLLLSGAHVDAAVYSWGVLVNNVAVFSMWPLLKRDGLGVQYIGLLLLWNRLIGYNPVKHAPKSFVELLSVGVYGAALVLHVLEMVITPPARYPDLFAVLNVLVCTPVFVLVWLWSIKRGIEIAWAVGGLGVSRSTRGREEKEEKADGSGSGYSYRQSGGRTVSLGYGQLGKRRSWDRAGSGGVA
ncbi:glucosyltransferase [Cyathus striatus]|nr:glucosyltransferase [Cyathus striatus]